MVSVHLGKLGPGAEIVILLHSNKGHVGVALCVWQERVFTRVLAVVQNLGFTAAGGGGEAKMAQLMGIPHKAPCLVVAILKFLSFLNKGP